MLVHEEGEGSRDLLADDAVQFGVRRSEGLQGRVCGACHHQICIYANTIVGKPSNQGYLDPNAPKCSKPVDVQNSATFARKSFLQEQRLGVVRMVERTAVETTLIPNPIVRRD